VLFLITFITAIPALYLFQPVLDDPRGSSVRMIELHYGALIAGAAESIAARLDALG